MTLNANNLTRIAAPVLLAGALLPADAASVMRTSDPVKVDGVLDEAVWKAAEWSSGFTPLAAYAKKNPNVAKTEFALAADGDTLYVAVRCHDPEIEKVKTRPDTSLWVADDVELFFAPDGTNFEFYQFAFSPNSKDVGASFWSEGGNIEPDHYAPKWSHAVGYEGGAWVGEVAIPLSAFYNTRNAVWKDEWRVNVTRTCTNPALSFYSSWSPLDSVYREPKRYRKVPGFPMRKAEDDLFIETVEAEMAGEREGRLFGKLKLQIHSLLEGDYTVGSSVGESVRVRLVQGVNEVRVPCAYEKNGRFRTWLTVTDKDGRVCERGYPVMVDYQPVRVNLTTPSYRNNFYPGQKADRVAGRLKCMNGRDAVLTIEGEGFPRREVVVKGGEGDFEFDTTGFAPGSDARLKVSQGAQGCFEMVIRHLAPTGHGMAWIENGNLVINGKPTFRRNIYAPAYKNGKRMIARLTRDLESFMTTPEFQGDINIEMGGAMERSEGVQDKELGEEHKKILDKIIEGSRESPAIAYYISDEPECRNLSPVYLRSVYEYVAKKDPYRIIFTASRGGADFAECADLFETHPYLMIRVDENGKRIYGRHPRDMHRYIENFGVLGRPDKCVGFLPTCFAYRWESLQSDYPTLDEYIAHVWAALIAGAKTLWPYAGHDIGDRPSVYEGCRHTFRQTAVLSDFLLHGKRTRFPRENDVDKACWELNGERLVAEVDYKTMKTKLDMPQAYRERIGGENLQAVVDGLERERLGHDNQLLGHDETIKVKSDMEGCFCNAYYKLYDGTRDVQAARTTGWKDERIEMSFGFTSEFDRVLVWGLDIKDLKLSLPDGNGGWTSVAAKSEPKGDYVELRLDERRKATGLRLDIVGTKPIRTEIYEIELPRPGGK